MALLNSISLQMFEKKIKMSSIVLSISLAEYLQFFLKMCFSNDKHVSDNNTYVKGGIG